jgi:hypothetical protein
MYEKILRIVVLLQMMFHDFFITVSYSLNVIDDYFDHYDYFDHFKILNFIISFRRRHRRRRQYEIIQKNFNETSFNIVKVYSLIISIQNKQSFKIFRIFFFSTHFHFSETFQNFIYSYK